MTIDDMQYDFKLKMNIVDSQLDMNFRVQQVDWYLNEGMELFIKLVAQPTLAKKMGLEVTQRSIDDLRTIVKEQDDTNFLTPTKFNNSSYIVTVPSDYIYYASSTALLTKNGCTAQVRSTVIVHDDLSEESILHSSNFEWRQSNIRFTGNNIKVFTDGSYSVDKVYLNYVRQPKYMHNAKNTNTGSYFTPDGITLLTGSQNCELPIHTHRDIVDIAVLIATGQLVPDYNIRKEKIKLTDQ